jgi:hypothetical protein
VAEADLSPTNIGEAGDIERIASLILGFWNRSFLGFSRDGNKIKDGGTIPIYAARLKQLKLIMLRESIALFTKYKMFS